MNNVTFNCCSMLSERFGVTGNARNLRAAVKRGEYQFGLILDLSFRPDLTLLTTGLERFPQPGSKFFFERGHFSFHRAREGAEFGAERPGRADVSDPRQSLVILEPFKKIGLGGAAVLARFHPLAESVAVPLQQGHAEQFFGRKVVVHARRLDAEI